MEVNFYKNKSDKKYVDKSIELITTANCIFKDDTTVKNPTLILSNINGITQSNYLYIEDFNRYYYIDNITFSQQRYYIDCSCDVLMSFSADIKNCTAIIERQENEYNLYLNDEEYKVYQYPRVQTKRFTNGFDTNSFILAIAGGK